MVGCGEYGICGWADIFEKCAGCRMVEALAVDDAQLVDEAIGGAQETGCVGRDVDAQGRGVGDYYVGQW